jgi:polyvinyl alcohol dehydrogenase (cytochrome)
VSVCAPRPPSAEQPAHERAGNPTIACLRFARITLPATLATALIALLGAPQAIAAAPCSAATASGGSWPSYGHDAANARTQPAEQGLTPSTVPGLAPRWVFSTSTTDDGSSFQSTPVVAGGCVFVGSTGGVAYAIDAATGKPVWQRRLDAPNPGLGGALVGAPAVSGDAVIFLVSETGAPYATALDRSTGRVLWRSAPVTTEPGSYTNASTVVAGGVVFMGYSPPEGDSNGQGGFALLSASTGRILKVTPTIPRADQAKGYAGGGLWSTPAYDPGTGYAYIGAGNPNSKQMEHPNTNAILKVDVKRGRSTFGRIVASYKGNVDQYSEVLQQASHTPVCAASDQPGVPYPVDDPACGQLDLDFGAAPNLFRDSEGHLLVGDLQKSGVYHVAHAGTMRPAWTALGGTSCQACNAASTAFDGRSIIGVFTPGGTMDAISRDDGAIAWRAPIGDGLHYQATSTAAGVAYTLDGNGFLDAFDAATGEPLLHRAMALDTGAPMVQLTSSGVAIAQHTVFVADTGSGNEGYVIAYGANAG